MIEVVTKAGLTVILDFCQQLDLVVVNYDYRYYTLHNFHYLKVIIQWIFNGKFADEGDNPSIYVVEGGNRLSHSLQPLTTGSVLKICLFFCTVQ